MDLPSFLERLGEMGYQTSGWEPAHGGLGLDKEQVASVEEILSRYQVPRGHDFVGRVLVSACIKVFGSEEQKLLLRDIACSRTQWCQLFSEPGAGSDLAGLSTRAVRDGDSWIVNGHKVWSSSTHNSDFGILLARTDPEQPKHKGITCFLVNMHSPGVEVRPLQQMTGGKEFNEVFFTDVLIPENMRLGPENEGWMVSTTALMNERGGLSSRPKIGAGNVDRVIEEAKKRGLSKNPIIRQELAALWCRERALQMTALRGSQSVRTGGAPGPEGSIGKLGGSELNQDIANIRIRILGPAAMSFEPLPPRPEPNGRGEGPTLADSSPQFSFYYSPAMTILGGSSNIQRNIIGERVLGLPKEPDPYKGVPWSNIPR